MTASAAFNLTSPNVDESQIVFRGHRFVPLVSGALFWPEQGALLVADLHFDKFGAFARRGSLLPPYDTALTLSRLEADVAATGADTVISLGDSFHRRDSHLELLETDRDRLVALVDRLNWHWIAGNHDPAGHDLGGACMPALERGGLTFVHEPRATGEGLVAGHLHPAAQIAMTGATTRRRCFVMDHRLLVMPAYGAGTGAMNILSPTIAHHFDWSTVAISMIGRDRIYPVSPKRLVRLGE